MCQNWGTRSPWCLRYTGGKKPWPPLPAFRLCVLLKSPWSINLPSLPHLPAKLIAIWMEAGVHGRQRWILFGGYVALMSCVERIPWGRRRDKTGQENNPREKARELSLEREKECRMNWFEKKKRESWKPGDSRKFLLVNKKEDYFPSL